MPSPMEDGPSQLEQNIAKFERLLADMRQATRESHSAIKQQRQLKKEIDKLLNTEITTLVNDRIKEVLEAELAKLVPGLREESRKIYDKVGSEVDVLLNICLGKRFSKKTGTEDLRPLLGLKMREWIDEILEEGR